MNRCVKFQRLTLGCHTVPMLQSFHSPNLPPLYSLDTVHINRFYETQNFDQTFQKTTNRNGINFDKIRCNNKWNLQVTYLRVQFFQAAAFYLLAHHPEVKQSLQFIDSQENRHTCKFIPWLLTCEIEIVEYIIPRNSMPSYWILSVSVNIQTIKIRRPAHLHSTCHNQTCSLICLVRDWPAVGRSATHKFWTCNYEMKNLLFQIAIFSQYQLTPYMQLKAYLWYSFFPDRLIDVPQTPCEVINFNCAGKIYSTHI